MKQAKLVAGFKSLFEGSADYHYQFSPTHTYQCNIKQIFQQQLRARYPQITIEVLVKEFHQYLTLPDELLGKRSSQILISSSRLLCCKLIDEQTLNKYKEIYNDLWKHFDQFPNTYLAPIYRIFKVQSTKPNFRQSDYFIIMPSLRPNFEDIITMYDIKGYYQGRQLDAKDFKTFKFGKDHNFIKSNQINLVQRADKEFMVNFLKIFINDISFLQSKNIIDYSLLLSFRKSMENQEDKKTNSLKLQNNIIMEWIIIDYLQEYNAKKKAENKFKLMFKKQVSSVEPQLYSQRFVKFIEKYFKIL